MRLSTVIFGKATVEYWSHHRRERGLNRAEEKREVESRDKDHGKEDVKISRWVAAEEDWPALHSADMPDHDAAKLIWAKAFTTAVSQLRASYEKQPVAPPDENDPA